MQRIVITGSTRGIGRGLAEELLARDCSVVVCGRSEETVVPAVAGLRGQFEQSRVYGLACDVTNLAQVERLWESAVARLDGVDIWINNAGLSHPMQMMWELAPEQVEQVWRANVLGTYYGARVAMRGMLAQGHGWIYNMEGFGSGGRLRKGMSAYGTSKAAVSYLTRALAAEAKETPVRVAALSPGMVMTDLVLQELEKEPERLQQSRRVLNIVADRLEDVTPWLAEQVLSNRKHGARIRWLTGPRLVWRFVSAPFSRRDVFRGTELAGGQRNED
ncbi:MAG: SDR family oxidoreductase [Anaerolineae bacterium]|nr:SDR family oxidoreductase [Anaerolineae bacterium]